MSHLDATFSDAPAGSDAGQSHCSDFEKDETGALMTMRMTLPDAGTRAAMLANGMEHGMEASTQRLETLSKSTS